MKNKKFLILTFFALFFLAAKDMPIRPVGVPENAIWNKHFKYWSIDGEYGSFKIWYKNGSLKIDQIIISKRNMKEIGYFENGKIRIIGQNVLLENKYREGKVRYEWRAYGKWKEYNEKSVLINEVCYTQIYNDREGEWNSEYCGEEIKYNDDGSVKEKIQHKLECKYGCEELECKDCIKK